MASKPQAQTIEWNTGEINQVIACMVDAQKAIAHFQQLFETRNGNVDFFQTNELALVAAMVRRWADWQPPGNINLKNLAKKMDDPDGGGSGDGGKNVPDSPR